MEIGNEQAVEVTEVNSARKIEVRFRGLVLMVLESLECDLLSDIRGLFAENPVLSLNPHFVFYHKDQRLEELSSLVDQVDNELEDVVLELRLESFNAQTASEHLSNMTRFFLDPDNYLNDGMIEFNTLMGKLDFFVNMKNAQKYLVNEKSVAEGETGGVKSIDDCSVIEQAEATGNLFFNSLALSKYISVIGTVHSDDYVYVDVETLEGQFFSLTLSSRGVFVNNSTRTEFKREQKSEAYPSLYDCLQAVSPRFAVDFKRFIDFADQGLYDAIYKCPRVTLPLDLGERSGKSSTFACVRPVRLWEMGLREILARERTEVFGHNLRTYRDWNEEIQNCRSLPSDDTLQHIQRIKVLRRVTDEFAHAAKQVALAVIRKQLSPLNPSQSIIEECFVFNNLFVTFAQDSVTWETPRGDTSPSSYSGVALDLKNVQQIYASDLKDVNVIHTAVVDYMGRRVVVQAIVSGILHFDQKTWTCYGSIDEGKTISNDESFEPIFKGLCEHFGLSLGNTFKDQEGREVEVHGSIDVKGIKAGDGRKYVMDLMRLSPRDGNYSDRTSHECCLLRPELIKNFNFITNIDELIAAKQSPETPADEKTVEEMQALTLKKCSVLNPSLLTLNESSNGDERTGVERDTLGKVAGFLRDNAMSYLVKDLNASQNSVPLDSRSLIDLMHKYGINVRYLGQIYKSLDVKHQAHMKRLLLRVGLVRSLRKFIRLNAYQVPSTEMVDLVVHLLNMFLGDKELRRVIDEKIQTLKAKGLRGERVASSVCKPKHYRQFKAPFEASNPLHELFLKSSEEVLGEVRVIADKRYGFSAELLMSFETLEFLSTDVDKLAFLREFAIGFGLRLVSRPYNFGGLAARVEYPLKTSDVLHLTPVVKSPEFSLEILRYNYRSAENELGEGKLETAMAVYRGCLNLIISTYGIFSNDFVYCCSKIASIHFHKGEKEEALHYQTLASRISERVHGLDHFSTASCILELSNYLYQSERLEESIRLHQVALYLFDIIGGLINPVSLTCLDELHVLFSQKKNTKQCVKHLTELLHRNQMVFGETDERITFLLGRLAALKAEDHCYQEASLLQARQLFIIKKTFKTFSTQDQNPKVLQMFEEKILESERTLKVFKQKADSEKTLKTGDSRPETKKSAKGRKGK